MFRPTFDLYIQLFPGRAEVEVPGTERREIVTGQGFDHPRLPVGDFGTANEGLVTAIERLTPSPRHRVGRLLLHVQHEWEGGLCEVELRALKDLAVNLSGLRTRILIYTVPRTLSKQDLSDLWDGRPGTVPGLLD